MMHEKLNIGRWEIDFLFAPDGYDTEEALTYLYYANASDHILRQAYHILEDNDPNTGFTFANQDSRQAVVVIGPTTSGEEFINTFCHEAYHVVASIIDSLGIDYRGEEPAYMIGDSARELTRIVCELGCDRCNKRRKSK